MESDDCFEMHLYPESINEKMIQNAMNYKEQKEQKQSRSSISYIPKQFKILYKDIKSSIGLNLHKNEKKTLEILNNDIIKFYIKNNTPSLNTFNKIVIPKNDLFSPNEIDYFVFKKKI